MMKNILIIDDDDSYRLLLRTYLEGMGYTVFEAADGKSGIQGFIQRSPDLVVLDLFMPEKDGLETITELKRDFPNCKIIAISAGGTMKKLDYLSVAEEFGADLALPKDVGKDVLLKAIKSLDY